MTEAVDRTTGTLTQAAEEILERMFFMAVDEVEAAPGDAPPLSALASEIEFHGEFCGRLRLVAPERCAREMASGFTGLLDPGQLTAEQVAEVVRELTNIVCGTTLSRMAPHAVFDLCAPRLLTPAQTSVNLSRPTVAWRLKTGPETNQDWIDLYWRWQEPPRYDAPKHDAPRCDVPQHEAPRDAAPGDAAHLGEVV